MKSPRKPICRKCTKRSGCRPRSSTARGMTITKCRTAVRVQRALAAGITVIALYAVADTNTLDPAAATAGRFTTPEQGSAAFSIPVIGLDQDQVAAWGLGKAQIQKKNVGVSFPTPVCV